MCTAVTGAQRVGEHAIVIGCSIAGLLAARVLSDAYERVTIIERDELPAVGHGRKAVPQGRHAHVLLASGQRAIEALLPGITGELLAAGAQPAKNWDQNDVGSCRRWRGRSGGLVDEENEFLTCK